MNISTAKPNNVFQFPLPLTPPTPEPKTTRGWSYLISESVAFNKDVTHGIRIQKPEQEKVPGWIRKLITSGQCNTIYVENLALNHQDRDLIQRLCQKHSVSLVNVGVRRDEKAGQKQNLVVGPW